MRHSDNAKAAETLAERIQSAYQGCNIRIGGNQGLCSCYAEKGGLLIGSEGGKK